MSEPTPVEMFWDTYDRYYHSVGQPPEIMLANREFKRELMEEMEWEMKYSVPQENWSSCWQWKSIPEHRIEYNGVKIDCVLNSDLPTLLCVAPCESGFDL